MQAIVVSDTGPEYAEGQIVSGPHNIARASDHGGVLLPVDEWLYGSGGALDGFFRRRWGTGWIFNKGQGERGCPMIVNLIGRSTFLHWAAYLMPLNGKPALGTVRLVNDSGQNLLSGGVSPVRIPTPYEEFLTKDWQGGVVMRGVSRVSFSTNGYIGVSLYCVASGLKCLWSAVSLCSRDE